MKALVETTISTKIIDAATGKVVKERAPEKNLVFDIGLKALAGDNTNSQSCTGNSMSAHCIIGSGTNPNSIASGGVTFTQSGTTITASGSFFTSAMVGGIFKYGTGTGGAEYYILSFTNATTVTVDTSATVTTPTVATVWQVQQQTIQTFLFDSATYQTNAGDNGTTFSGNTVTHKRTYIFAQQGSPYTVNEIGYARQSSASHFLNGRIVLSSSDVVGTANFYVVVISITITFLPGTPLAVTNVGTNINTAGNLMLELASIACFGVVGSSGTVGSQGFFDNGGSATLLFASTTYTQNAATNSTTTPNPTLINVGAVSWGYNSAVLGQMKLTFTGSVSTTGQSLFGVAIGGTGANQYACDVKFTTTQTAPTGTFTPNTVWALTFGRQLSN